MKIAKLDMMPLASLLSFPLTLTLSLRGREQLRTSAFVSFVQRPVVKLSFAGNLGAMLPPPKGKSRGEGKGRGDQGCTCAS
jgi:hypothetical protein